MKKIILLFLMVVAITNSAFSEKRTLPMQVYKGGSNSKNLQEDRCPINLPIVVYYDSDTNILEVWCDNDNIQAEIFVYGESGVVEAYSPYMNVTLQLSSSSAHSFYIIGDDWEAEGLF